MEINNISNIQNQYEQTRQESEQIDAGELNDNLTKLAANNEDEALKAAINDFMSIFMQQMFQSMRNTVPDDGIINGGYAEDVFTEMLDEEISQTGSEQGLFKDINRQIYQQLSGE
ncbi:rod-binding protein [Halanaerobiaceae bacterium Z-7014]|uniref:Rod-binding protein n=1 Tax=Halonatronomonas betaini TaxID=2778430 RepID=A0A931F977_9FIRM|nr:rod-binding protein [Halonatronomonas betaini]MBF8435717.1 rod-binding protein [Halonatronomonas betaini]